MVPRFQSLITEGESLGDVVVCGDVMYHQVERVATQGAVSNCVNGVDQVIHSMLYWCCLANVPATSPWIDITKSGLEILCWALAPVCLPMNCLPDIA